MPAVNKGQNAKAEIRTKIVASRGVAYGETI